MLISIAEYAKAHGRNPRTVQQKCIRGGFHTARKIGRNWVIDSDEPYIDGRLKGRDYVGWRKRKAADLTGRRFGRLVAMRPTGESNPKKGRLWECRCDCGNTRIVPAAYLLEGRCAPAGACMMSFSPGTAKEHGNQLIRGHAAGAFARNEATRRE